MQNKNSEKIVSNQKIYYVIGMMSGTSLDGIDLSLAEYRKSVENWQFSIIDSITYQYSQKTVDLIKSMENESLSYLQFRKKELQYSQVVVDSIKKFINSQKINKIKIDAIGFHGHTIFHNPKQGITVQIGNLSYIAAKLRLNIVGNFRQLDIHRGGQGAPLAPFGQQLFGQQKVFLNLGGIANVGYKGKGCDIFFCNMVLNKFSQKIAKVSYDEDGIIGSSGKCLQQYLKQLKNRFSNYNNRSLAREDVEVYLKQIENSQSSIQVLTDQMRSFYELISVTIVKQIANFCLEHHVPKENNKNYIYCTGGGALNKFLLALLNRVGEQKNIQFFLPDKQIINFKQALIFGLLAVKFLQAESNCASGVGGMLVKGTSVNIE